MGTHSTPGGYVQLPEADLPSIQLEHLTSAIDMSISLPETLAASSNIITGYTEWIGRWKNRDLSIGWDWAFVNGGLILIHADEIRSNIQVIGGDGVPTSRSKTMAHLAAWIEALPWRDGVPRELVQRNRRPAR
jgi:hypothetical protein